MSSHQTSAKSRSSKCRHFCFLFETHNYCPTYRESGKGDDLCLTNQAPCNICANFSEKEQIKIKHRRRYVRKQKALKPCNTSKDDLDLLGDNVEAFSGSQADLQGSADNLFSSPPRPQPLRFESLSLKTPQTVAPTPGTALQNKIESRLEKSLGNQFNIQLQQQMGVFQVSMLEAMKSLRDEMQSMKKASEVEVDKTSASLSKAGPSKQPDPTTTRTSHPTRASDNSDAQPMDTNAYGPPLPPKFTQSVQSDPASKHSDLESDHLFYPHSEDHSEQAKRACSKAKKHSDKKTHKVRAKYYSQSSSSEEDQSSVPIKKSTKPQQKAPDEPEHQQDSTDPGYL